jgi:cytochrome P450
VPDEIPDPAVPALFGPEFAADPYRSYAWLREHAPVRRTELPSGVEAWLVTRYEDAKRALADQRLSKNPGRHSERSAHGKGKVGIPGERSANLMTHLLNIDPPDHTRLRRLVAKAFTPRRVAEFEPRVRELTDGLIDAILARQQRGADYGTAELIHEFAFPLPIYAICDMLGVPVEDQGDFRDWAGMMLRHGPPRTSGSGEAPAAPRGGVGRAVKKMRAYLAELIHRKRDRPGDDLISGLIRASDHGEQLTENEAAAMAFILLFAGFETTINLIGNGTYTLLRHPDQLDRLQRHLAAGDESLLATGVEELLRYDGPVELATWRFATEPITLGGQRIAEGEPVLVVLAAADRDPAKFAEPDVLDLARGDNQHLGYGHGIHYCLGAPLARLEGRTALAALLHRLPDLRLAADPSELRWRGGLIMRGLRTLPVRFDPEQARSAGPQPDVGRTGRRTSEPPPGPSAEPPPGPSADPSADPPAGQP